MQHIRVSGWILLGSVFVLPAIGALERVFYGVYQHTLSLGRLQDWFWGNSIPPYPILLMTSLYFLPFVRASLTDAPKLSRTLLINLFAGWTVIGWLVSLRRGGSSSRSTAEAKALACVGIALATLLPLFQFLPVTHDYNEFYRMSILCKALIWLLGLIWAGITVTKAGRRGHDIRSRTYEFAIGLCTSSFVFFVADLSLAFSSVLQGGARSIGPRRYSAKF